MICFQEIKRYFLQKSICLEGKMAKIFKSDGGKIVIIESGKNKAPTFFIFSMPKLMNFKIQHKGKVDSKLTLDFLFKDINHYSTSNLSEVSGRLGENFSRENLLKLINADIEKKVEVPKSIIDLNF